jgi:hypothetical protein
LVPDAVSYREISRSILQMTSNCTAQCIFSEIFYVIWFTFILICPLGQNHDIKIGNRCFGNVEQFKYLGTTIANQNLIQEEIKRRLNSSLRNIVVFFVDEEVFVNVRLSKLAHRIMFLMTSACSPRTMLEQVSFE